MVVKCIYSRWSFSCAGVWRDIVCTTEDLEGWVTFNTKALAEIGLFCAINLAQSNLFLLQSCSCLFIFGGQCFAVTTPRCENYKKNELVDSSQGTAAMPLRGDSHSNRAKSLSLTKSGNVSLVREATSEAEAIAAPARANATHLKVRILKVFLFTGLRCQSVSKMDIRSIVSENIKRVKRMDCKPTCA